MSFLYYFRECPTCKNHARNLVKSCALRLTTTLAKDIHIDERYILALPDIWGEEADLLSARGAKVPFLYNDDDASFLNVDMEDEDMEDKIEAFLTGEE